MLTGSRESSGFAASVEWPRDCGQNGAGDFRWHFMGRSADLFTSGQHIDAKGQQIAIFLPVWAQVRLAGDKNRG
jgi:hypothetical protein